MFNLENRIRLRIVRALKNRGFDASIGHVRWRANRLRIDGLSLEKADGSGQSVRVEKLTIGLSLWRSFIHFALEGELIAQDICVDLRAVSDVPLSLKNIESAFRLGKKQRITQVDIEGVSFILQINRSKTHDDFYLQIPGATWDEFIEPVRPALLCPWIKNARSDDKLSLLAHYRHSKAPGVSDCFNAKIEAKDFSPDYPGQNVPVDRAFLVQTLTDKLDATYVPFEKLPKNLVDAFICTEDPAFWEHKGVSPYFIGYAIRENIQHHKIARGASTITMQVARNLFLNHHRTLLRKVEESIIALLLENHFKIGKQTIFELYANLIEFAPGVYGVADASRFYFDKELSELTLTEILALTYIIPRPVHFYEALLEKTQQLQTNLRQHIPTYASVMVRKGVVSREDFDSIDYTIRFAAPFGVLNLSLQP